MQYSKQLILVLIVWVVCACEGSFRSNVPMYPVNLRIDTRMGSFVHFQPTATGDYIIADQEGYHYKENLVVRTVLDAYGYGGVLVYIDGLSNYNAWDLACPYCAIHGRCEPCVINGFYAICPHCEEAYDLSAGTAHPTKGKSHEPLRRIPLINSDGVLIIKQ